MGEAVREIFLTQSDGGRLRQVNINPRAEIGGRLTQNTGGRLAQFCL